KSDDVAMEIGSNSEVVVESSIVDGAAFGIDSKSSVKVKVIDGANVRSAGTAIRSTSSLDLTVRNAQLSGGAAAIDAPSSARVTLSKANVVGQRKLGRDARVDER